MFYNADFDHDSRLSKDVGTGRFFAFRYWTKRLLDTLVTLPISRMIGGNLYNTRWCVQNGEPGSHVPEQRVYMPAPHSHPDCRSRLLQAT